MKRISIIATALLLASTILSACSDASLTATPIIPPTATATTAPDPTPLPTPNAEPTTAPSSADYEELAMTSYTTEFGSTNVVGVFRYHGTQPVFNPDVTVTATDPSGKVVDTDPFILKTVILKPNSLLLYQASFLDPLPEGSTVTTKVSGGSTDKDLLDALSGDFEATNLQFVASDFYPNGKKATGTLKNIGTTTTNNIQILIAFWGENNQLLDVETGTTTNPTLAPNEESDFSVDSSNASKVVRTDVVVSASVGN